MKIFILIGVGLYGVANLFAGTVGLIMNQLPRLDALALLVSEFILEKRKSV